MLLLIVAYCKCKLFYSTIYISIQVCIVCIYMDQIGFTYADRLKDFDWDDLKDARGCSDRWFDDMKRKTKVKSDIEITAAKLMIHTKDVLSFDSLAIRCPGYHRTAE